MEHFSKPRNLLIVQVDSMTGETAGMCIGLLYENGAMNVQALSSVTKKNRPGMVFIIDCGDDSLDSVERVIVRDMGATGWHRVASEHCYIAVNTEKRDIVVSAGGKSFPIEIQRKVSSAEPELIRPEYDCCAELKKRLLDDCGIQVSIAAVTQKVTQAFLDQAKEPEIVFEN